MDDLEREKVLLSLLNASSVIGSHVVDANAINRIIDQSVKLIENMLRSVGFDDAEIDDTMSEVQKSLQKMERNHHT